MANTRNDWLTHGNKGLLIHIRLTPNASRDEIGGLIQTAEGPALAARVRAIPDKGKANKAAIALLAKWLGVPKSDIELKSGTRSRLKTFLISGSSQELEKLARECLAEITE